MKRFFFLVIALTGISILLAGCERQESKPVEEQERKSVQTEIGTGDITGLYYLTGAAISRMVNKKFGKYNIKAEPCTTSGSVANVDLVLTGKQEFGIVQSDRLYQAYHGQAEWSDSRQEALRSVFSLHTESITLVASGKSNIRKIRDLEGKRVNLGHRGSGQLQNSKDVLKAADLTEQDLFAKYVEPVEALRLFREESLDAFFYTVGHPNDNIEEATSGKIVKVFIIPIEGSERDKIVERYPYYKKVVIPHSLYPDALNKEDIETIGVKATFVTSKDVDEDIVYAITKEVFKHLKEFREIESLKEVFEGLKEEEMLEGLSAPIHKGALKYYKEAGLDKHIDSTLIVD